MLSKKANDYHDVLKNVLNDFMFEEHTEELRNRITDAYYELLNANVDLRDFAVVCDENNNTQERVAAGQLWVDIAIMWNGEEAFTHYPLRVMPGQVGENDESDSDGL